VAFRDSEVFTVACGYFHTMSVKTDGALWTFGIGDDGALGHNDRNTRLVPTCISGDRGLLKAPCTPRAKHQASGASTGRQSWCPRRASPQACCSAHASGAATICRLCTPSPLLWARSLGLSYRRRYDASKGVNVKVQVTIGSS